MNLHLNIFTVFYILTDIEKLQEEGGTKYKRFAERIFTEKKKTSISQNTI